MYFFPVYFEFFHIPWLFGLDALLYLWVMIFSLLLDSFYLKCFPLRCLVGLLSFSIASSFQLASSSVFLSPDWIPSSSLRLSLSFFINHLFVFSWMFISLQLFSLISFNFFVFYLNSLISLMHFLIVLLTSVSCVISAILIGKYFYRTVGFGEEVLVALSYCWCFYNDIYLGELLLF